MMDLNGFQVYKCGDQVAFNWVGKTYGRFVLSPVELASILYVFRGMSEHEDIDSISISHVCDPRAGYYIRWCGNEKFLKPKEAFVLMLGLEKIIGEFLK